MASRRQEILDAIVADVFGAITTAGGYNFTLAVKERGIKNKGSLNDSQFPALFLSSADEVRRNITAREFESVMTVFVTGYVKAPGNEDVQAELDKLVGDLTRALWQDPTLGSKALNMEIVSVDTDAGDEHPNATFVMQIEYIYKKTGTVP